MVFFNYALRKLNAKIVYYGPGLCGKTTNLQWIHDHFEGGQRGKMISLATEGDRTIFFDLLPIDIGTIRGMDVTLQLYTVPGQVHYNSTRQLVLRGADGVVFVADSQRTMKASNVESFENLQENLMLQGIDLKSFPHVLQFNKRDLRDLLSTEDLNESINLFSVPIFEAIATEGIGVQETLEGIVKLVMRNLREKYEPVANASGPQAPSPVPGGGPVPFQAPGAKAPPADVPKTVIPPPAAAPPEEETTRDVGFDSGFAAFEDEDEVPTSVYDSGSVDPYAETAGPKTPVIDAGAVAAADASGNEETSDDEPAEARGGDDIEGLFTDPRDEDGTDPEIRLPPPVERPVRGFEDDLGTDPEIVPDADDAEGPSEGLEELFEPEASGGEPEPVDIVVDSTPSDDFAFGGDPSADEDVDVDVQPADDEPPADDVVSETASSHEIRSDDFAFGAFGDEAEGERFGDEQVIAPVEPPTERYEDRIEAPGPFAPGPQAGETAAAEVAAETDDDQEEVHAEVRQALGAAEDLEALKSLYSDELGTFEAPPEGMPVPPPFDAPEIPAEPPETDEVAEPAEPPPVEDEPAEPERRVEPEPESAPAAEAGRPSERRPSAGAEPITDAPARPVDPMARSQPIMVGSGDPFADHEDGVSFEGGRASVVPVSTGVNVTAEDNQLHLQLKGSGAIAEMGQVRALDIEVPVPGQWVGNRKVTLQLRLTLTPAEQDND